MLRAGAFRERVTIQSKTLAKDAFHEQEETWADVACVPASVVPQSASEQISADRIETQQRLLVTIRHRTDVTVKNRLEHIHDGITRYYDILSVNPRGYRKKAVDIVAVYEQDNG